MLRKAADEITARKEELGTLLSREEGKTLAEGIGETVRAAQIFDFFAGECLRLAGEILPSVRPGIGVEITREAVGPVGLITPWNFPIAIPAWKIAPALAWGNTVVIKPADLVPGCTWAIVDILHRAGLPNGVLNLVMGKGSVVGQAILDSPDIRAVSFTGSVGTGRRVAEASIKVMRKFQLEMGGKNPMVVLDDADLEVAVEACLNGAFYSTGQRCTASSRLIVQDGIHDRFVARLSERMAALDGRRSARQGDADRPGGRRRASSSRTRATSASARTRARARRRRAGEARDRGLLPRAGALRRARPTTCGSAARRSSARSPSVIRVKDYDEALSVANDTEFGLSAGICTTSLKHATHFKRNSQAGMVMVNVPTAGVDFHVPFGGSKGSSFGPREQGRYAAEFYTTVKTAYTAA